MADRTDDPDWWPAAHQRVLDGARGLSQARNPRALEQATAELIGAELYDAVREQRQGMRFEVWATQLIGRAADRVAAHGAGWHGAWRLLHGMASIGPFGLDFWAMESATRAAKAVPAAALARQPAWLNTMRDVKPTGDVRVLHDTDDTRSGVIGETQSGVIGGSRSGVIAEFRYPGDGRSQWYLLDIGTSPATGAVSATGRVSAVGLLSAGAFATPERAAAAWRDQSGLSTEAPSPATPESLGCLVQCGHDEPVFIADNSRSVMDNWFRGPRRVTDLLDHLPALGITLPP
jgi:hypothetical protein